MSASAFLSLTEVESESVASLLGQLRIGRAFFGLRDLFAGAAIFADARGGHGDAKDVAAARLFLHRTTPLLSCYLPDTAERIWSHCGFPGNAAAVNWDRLVEASPPEVRPNADEPIALFPEAPLFHKQVRHEYGRRVDERRERRTLGEELTDARADDLCVCPVDLREQ